MTVTDEQSTGLLFDPRDPGMRADPYPYYHRLRAADPVHRTPFGYWVLSRHRDVDAIVRDPRGSSDFPHDEAWARHRGGAASPAVRSSVVQGPVVESPVVQSTAQWMMMLDGAAHRRVRGMVSQVFTARAVERLRPRIAAAIDGLIDKLGDGEVDLVRELALPLPIMVIGELLGLPPADRDQCRAWTDSIGHVIDPIVTPAMQVAMNQAVTEFSEYLAGQLTARRAHPGPDLLSSMATMEDNGERLTDDEIIANTVLMFNAGHETTVNLIGNGMLALLKHPEQLQRLRENPGLIDQGVDELIRYDAPVQMAARIMTADTELGETTIRAGAKVMLLYGAANRDPARYAEPDRLDLGRTGVKSLAFGGGPHFCLGAPLARLEVAMAFTALLERYPSIELATEEHTWRPNLNLRGLTGLSLKLA
jgi:cytochrome P450